MLGIFRKKSSSRNDFDWDKKNAELVRLIHTGKIDDAVEPAMELVEYVDKKYRKDSKEKATTYNNAGMVFLLAKDYAVAEECFRDALDMRKRLFGKDHNEVAVILLNLSQLYKSMAQDILKSNRLETPV